MRAVYAKTRYIHRCAPMIRLNRPILQPGYAYGNEFDFGLNLMLDGIAAALAQERGGA